MKPYKYFYGWEVVDTPGNSAIVKFNLETKERTVWKQPGCVPGEPIFIPKPNGKAEDEGVILSVVLDSASEKR
jgi:torulene dioxygenase